MPVDVDSRGTEPISLEFLQNFEPVTGASLRYDVTRVVAGATQWLNRTTATFVASPPADGDRYRSLVELDDVNEPGVYTDAAGGVNLPAITNRSLALPGAPLVYVVRFYETAPDARYLGSDEIRAAAADNARQQLTNRETLAANGTGRVYADDDATVIGAYTVTDKSGDPIDLPAGAPARRTAQT